MKTYNNNDIIFKQGDYADSMFDITAGSVGIYVAYGTEHENRLAVLKAGHFLGEMGLIDECPRSATAVALEDGTTLAEIGEKEFSGYFPSVCLRSCVSSAHACAARRGITRLPAASWKACAKRWMSPLNAARPCRVK